MTSPDDHPRPFGRRKERHRVTIVHGDRVRAFQVDMGWLTAGAAVVGVFSLAYVAATGYLFFRDDILNGAISRQVRQARAYEDRVATLRAEIDRINGRQLMDQEAFEAKIDTLLKRQATLGEAQSRIGTLVDRASAAGVRLVPGPAANGSVTPIGQTLDSVAPSADAELPKAPPPLDVDRFATPLRSSWNIPFVTPAHAGVAGRGASVGLRIAQVEKTLDGFERLQRRTLDDLARLAEADATKAGRLLGRLGFRVADAPHPKPKPATGDAVGGPFVPFDPTDAAERADAALTRLDRIRRAAARLPLGRPIRGDTTTTSNYGSRIDPFLGTPALHTGMDFRAETGEPVLVTGPGTVISAGAQGGYGLCVDVDHGNGVVTRYGHMSRISVEKGRQLKAGDVVGLAGSTGRSTGPHLHYETRVSGDPVDPGPWLEAGRELGF
jgi:murein DD-endopeptidase MepM/ murein hydrolase activator NlpD